MRQGAVGYVRLVERQGRLLVEKRVRDPVRLATEVLALRALAGSDVPVPEVVQVQPPWIVMTCMEGDRLDDGDLEARLRGLRSSAGLLRRLHEMPVPRGLPSAPDDVEIIRLYRAAGGPPVPLSVPDKTRTVFCHGDWTDGNLLAKTGSITAVVDWEKAHVGDPIRELSRAAWGAAQKDPRAFDVIVNAYGADPATVRQWSAIHAAELWLWFLEAGPPAYLERLTAELLRWPVVPAR